MTQQFGAMAREHHPNGHHHGGSSNSSSSSSNPLPVLSEFHIDDFIVYENVEDDHNNPLNRDGHKRSASAASVGSTGSACPLMALLDDLEDLVLPDTLNLEGNIQHHSRINSGNLQSSSSSYSSSTSIDVDQYIDQKAKDSRSKSRSKVSVAYESL